MAKGGPGWRRFGLRALFAIVFTAAVFCGGYRLGFDAGRDGRFDGLIDLITATVAPDDWTNTVGPGSLEGMDDSGCFLFVDETAAAADDPFAAESTP